MVQKADKRKRDDDKDTEFVFGGMRWTKERAANTAKRSKRQDPVSTAMDVDTPADVSYKTPRLLIPVSPEAVVSRARRGTAQEPDVISIASSDGTSVQGHDHHSDTLAIAWHGLTKSTLDKMLAQVDVLVKNGELDAGGGKLVQVWEGYKTVLGPLHDETKSVAYRLASFYAEQDMLISAHEVLDETSRAHIEQLGVDDRRSWQHVLHVVELLRGWNKPNEALAFLARAKDIVATIPAADPAQSARRSTRKGKKRMPSLRVAPVTAQNIRLLEAAHNIVNDQDPAQMDNGLQIARSYVTNSDQAVQPLLVAILQQCGHDTNRLAKQRLNSWTELLKLYAKLDTVWDNIRRIEDASQAFDDVLAQYPWEVSKFTSLEIMEALLELAAAFLRCGRDGQAYRGFQSAVDKAEILYDAEDERSVWVLISVGLVYQAVKGWAQASPWFEQALASALPAFGEKDGITQALEAAREKRYFSYLNDEGRPFTSVFGVSGLTIRPTRLHIE